MRRLTVLASLLAFALAASAGFAAYPERPVKLIVPWAAGGDTDASSGPSGSSSRSTWAPPWSSPT